MDKLEEISSGKKEAPAADGGRDATEARVADTRGEASVSQDAVTREAGVGRAAVLRGGESSKDECRDHLTGFQCYRRSSCRYQGVTSIYRGSTKARRLGNFRHFPAHGATASLTSWHESGPRIRTHYSSRLVAEKATDDAQELNWAVGLRHVVIASGGSCLLLIALHRE
jgi:hypothetical protein